MDRSQVSQAVEALQAVLKTKEDPLNLVDTPDKIDLQFTLKKIPNVKNKHLNLSLPHSIHYENREVCLFVKDLDQKDREYDKTVQHFEQLLKQKNVKGISKIVPLKALHTDYCQPHLKRNLAKAYDLFLADDRVIGMLPGKLGKIFYAKKKTVPVQVNLKAGELKTQLEKVIHNSRCELQGSGSSCMVYAAHTDHSTAEIVDNIVAAATQIMEKIPGGAVNIRNMYIKSSNTSAVPIYMDFGSPNDVKLEDKKKAKPTAYIDEVTTVKGGKVRVTADGHVTIIPDKKRKSDTYEEMGGKKAKLEQDEADDSDKEIESNEDSDESDSDDTEVSKKVAVKKGKENKKNITAKVSKTVNDKRKENKNAVKPTIAGRKIKKPIFMKSGTKSELSSAPVSNAPATKRSKKGKGKK